MSIILKLVKDGTYAESDYNGARGARVIAIMSGFTPVIESTSDIFTVNQQAANAAAAEAGIGPGSDFPGSPPFTCVCIGVRAHPTKGDNWIVIWDFDRPTGFTTGNGVTNSLYIVARQKMFIDVNRVKLPHVKSGSVIQLGWTDPDDADNVIKPKTVHMQIRKPALQIVIAGRFNEDPSFTSGSSSYLIEGQAGTVNDSAFLGRDRGYWLFVGSEVTQDPGSTTRFARFSLVTLIDEDWSEYLVVEHPSGITPAFTSAQIAAVAGAYPASTEGQSGGDGKGYIRPAASLDTNGIARFGPFPATTYSDVFRALVLS